MLYIVQVGTTCTELIKSSNTCTFNSQLTGTRNLLLKFLFTKFPHLKVLIVLHASSIFDILKNFTSGGGAGRRAESRLTWYHLDQLDHRNVLERGHPPILAGGQFHSYWSNVGLTAFDVFSYFIGRWEILMETNKHVVWHCWEQLFLVLLFDLTALWKKGKIIFRIVR